MQPLHPEVEAFELRVVELYAAGTTVTKILKARSRQRDDLVIRQLGRCTAPGPEELCLIAIGSYGRHEMTLYSDLDFILLHHGLSTERLAHCDTEFVLPLHRQGLHVHIFNRDLTGPVASWRTDLFEQTVTFEARYVAGSREIYDDWYRRTRAYWTTPRRHALLQALISDYRQYLQTQTNDDLEPDLKRGFGGLREFNFLTWARLAVDRSWSGLFSASETARLQGALMFLWRLRDTMERLVGAPHTIMNRELHPALALALGTGSLLDDYHAHTEVIHRLCTGGMARLAGDANNRHTD